MDEKINLLIDVDKKFVNDLIESNKTIVGLEEKSIVLATEKEEEMNEINRLEQALRVAKEKLNKTIAKQESLELAIGFETQANKVKHRCYRYLYVATVLWNIHNNIEFIFFTSRLSKLPML